MNAFVNGYKCIVYGFVRSEMFTYCDCYFPELGIRKNVISSDIHLS